MMKVIRMPIRSIKIRISNKNTQKLVFFPEKTVFKQSMREIIKIFGQKCVIRLKSYSISERAEEGLSSHAFISIFIFLTKIDIFGGGGWP